MCKRRTPTCNKSVIRSVLERLNHCCENIPRELLIAFVHGGFLRQPMVLTNDTNVDLVVAGKAHVTRNWTICQGEHWGLALHTSVGLWWWLSSCTSNAKGSTEKCQPGIGDTTVSVQPNMQLGCPKVTKLDMQAGFGQSYKVLKEVACKTLKLA